MDDKYLNPIKYEELQPECTGSDARRFISKDGKELVEVRGADITTTYKNDAGVVSVSWRRVGDTD
jgi:hypothetical protein